MKEMDPSGELERLQGFMGVEPDEALAAAVDNSRIGNWREAFTANELAAVEWVTAPTLKAYVYRPAITTTGDQDTDR